MQRARRAGLRARWSRSNLSRSWSRGHRVPLYGLVYSRFMSNRQMIVLPSAVAASGLAFSSSDCRCSSACPDLDKFATIDESRWIQRGADFWTSMRKGDDAGDVSHRPPGRHHHVAGGAGDGIGARRPHGHATRIWKT